MFGSWMMLPLFYAYKQQQLVLLFSSAFRERNSATTLPEGRCFWCLLCSSEGKRADLSLATSIMAAGSPASRLRHSGRFTYLLSGNGKIGLSLFVSLYVKIYRYIFVTITGEKIRPPPSLDESWCLWYTVVSGLGTAFARTTMT